MTARETARNLRMLTESVKWVGPNDVDRSIICNLCCTKVVDSPSTRAQHEDFHAGIAAMVKLLAPGLLL